MAEIRLKESLRYRKIGGGFLVFLWLVLSLFIARFILPYANSASDMIIMLLGPCMLLLGVWTAFPRRPAALRMVITDSAIQITPLPGDIAVI